MDLENAAIELTEIGKDNLFFIRTSHPIVDFTKPFAGTMQICGKHKILSIDLHNENELCTIFYLLNETFNEKSVIITWNIKEIISYFKYNFKNTNIKFNGKIFDLMLMESFSGINQTAPENLKESIKRLEVVLKNEKLKIIHNKIHIPLALNVIPSMETHGVLDMQLKKIVYPTYQIEGQINGRLLCNKSFSNSVNPHHLTQEDKNRLKLKSNDECFVYFDFNCNELFVLQYLSKDKKLGELIDKGGDCYSNIWEALFCKPCVDANQRKFIKNSFLKIIYGMQAEALSQEFDFEINTANSFISSIRTLFPEAFGYIDSYQKLLKINSKIEDFFGRTRTFDEKSWSVRNFVVASPAAIICLEKLIDLYDIIGNKLIFNIHDAYIMRANLKLDQSLIIECKKILETPSKLAPGLKLTVNCEVGFRLNKLKTIKI